MNARSLHKMTLKQPVIQGGDHASRSLYTEEPGRLRPCCPALAKLLGPGRSWSEMHRRRGAAGLVLRRLAADLDCRRLPAAGRGALRPGRVPSAVGHLARVCRLATADP